MKIEVKTTTVGKPSAVQSSKIDPIWLTEVKPGEVIKVLDYKGVSQNHHLMLTDQDYQYSYWYAEHIKIDRSVELSKEDFKYIFMYATEANINKYYEPLLNAMDEFGITDKVSIAAFLAQVAHESGCLKYNTELASGIAYNNRADLGNDKGYNFGVKYKGRGLIQVTGFYNYEKYGRILGLDLVNRPELAAEPAENSARIAAAYWKENNLSKVAAPNTFDAFKTVTRRINGGYNGLQDRTLYWTRARQRLGIT